MLKRLHELLNIFISQGYDYEGLEILYRDSMDNEKADIKSAEVEELINALESEMSYWEE